MKATQPEAIGAPETANSAVNDTAQPSKHAADVAWFLSLTPEQRLESCVQLVEMRENAKRSVAEAADRPEDRAALPAYYELLKQQEATS